MRWLSKLRRGRPSDVPPEQIREARPPGDTPLVPADRLILFLLFDALPVPDAVAIQQDIAGIEPLATPVHCSTDQDDSAGTALTISFDGHVFALMAMNAPVPADSAQNAIETSNWSADEKEPLRRHQTHMVCAFLGTEPDPTEQFIAALKVAAAFLRYGLVGVIDPAAWNCLPARAVTFR